MTLSTARIIFMSDNEEVNLQYIEALQKQKLLVNFMEQLEEGVDIENGAYFGVIIKENHSHSIEMTCSKIMTIKRHLGKRPYIWIISKDNIPLNHIVYLKLGADGNFSEEIFPQELALHIKNTVKREASYFRETTESTASSAKQSFQLLPADYCIVFGDGQRKWLSRLEYKLLEVLVNNINQTVSYEKLYKAMWSRPYTNETQQIANIVFRLRKKIEAGNEGDILIKTVRLLGYRMEIVG